MFIHCYVFGQLSSVKRLAKGTYLFQNICSAASRVQDCWNLTFLMFNYQSFSANVKVIFKTNEKV